MTTRTSEFLGELRLGRQAATTRQVVLRGLAIVLGLLFLIGERVLTAVGPWAVLAAVLAAVVQGATLVNVLELLGGSSERGGTYILIQETLGGLGAFLGGWSLLAGSLVLTVALVQATAVLFQRWLLPSLPASTVALGLLGVLMLLHLFRSPPGRTAFEAGVAVLMVLLLLAALRAVPHLSLPAYRLGATISTGRLLRSVARLTITYVAFEALLASRRQIRQASVLLLSAFPWLLAASALTLAIPLLIAAGLRPVSETPATRVIDTLIQGSSVPRWSAHLLVGIALVLSTNGCLMVAARQMRALGREGALPYALQRVWRPFAVPPLVFLTLGLLGAPLILWASSDQLIDWAAGSFLTAMTLLNAAAIRSRYTEPERRRLLEVPFHPLVPATAIAVNVVLLSTLSRPGLAGLGLWLLLGSAYYAAYARRRQVTAREGVLVFGREGRRREREGAYRILVPLSPQEERHLLLHLATALARQLDGEVIPLQVIPVADPLAIEEGRHLAQERNALFRWSVRLGADMSVPITPITRLAHNVPEGILDTAVEEGCDLILLPWTVSAASPGGFRMGHVLDPVVRRAPCDVAVVAHRPENVAREAPEAWRPESIVVPTAGGPHAPLAARLALLLAREYGATVTALYVVEPGASSDELAQARERIQQTIQAMRAQTESWLSHDGHPLSLEELPIERRVATAENVVEGIVQVGAEADLVLIGASEESLIDQVLFGSVPEQVARLCPTPVVMVKRYRGLPRFWLQRTWDALYEALPELTREERVEVYRAVRRGARPNVDFFVMMGLAAIIATFGLLQNSPAVIIGAMLVAPLFTPVLALSLAIVQGDVRLVRLAVESILKGIALAVGLSALLAMAPVLRTVTPEIVARSHPNLLDLAVALASGAAGAYAIARKNVAAALPGVAIAAALMPPLSVVGIGLVFGDLRIAGGGTLLFATNLIAIVLAGAITLLLLGFRPTHWETRAARLRIGLAATVVLLLFITIPLGIVFVRSVRASRTERIVRQTLQIELAALPDVALAEIQVRQQGDELTVTVTLYAQRPVTAALARRLSHALSVAVARPVRLQLISIPTTTIEVPP